MPSNIKENCHAKDLFPLQTQDSGKPPDQPGTPLKKIMVEWLTQFSTEGAQNHQAVPQELISLLLGVEHRKRENINTITQEHVLYHRAEVRGAIAQMIDKTLTPTKILIRKEILQTLIPLLNKEPLTLHCKGSLIKNSESKSKRDQAVTVIIAKAMSSGILGKDPFIKEWLEEKDEPGMERSARLVKETRKRSVGFITELWEKVKAGCYLFVAGGDKGEVHFEMQVRNNVKLAAENWEEEKHFMLLKTPIESWTDEQKEYVRFLFLTTQKGQMQTPSDGRSYLTPASYINAGFGTAINMMVRMVEAIPRVYFLQFARTITADQLRTVVRNTSPFLRRMAAKYIGDFREAEHRLKEESLLSLSLSLQNKVAIACTKQFNPFNPELLNLKDKEGERCTSPSDPQMSLVPKIDIKKVKAKITPDFRKPHTGCPALKIHGMIEEMATLITEAMLNHLPHMVAPREENTPKKPQKKQNF
jgi:hypothetical protein